MPFKNISSEEANFTPFLADFNLQTLDLLSNLEVRVFQFFIVYNKSRKVMSNSQEITL